MTHVNQPIAIIGMACRLPGGATNPDRFWQLLCNGVDAIGEVPEGRWNWRLFYDQNRDKPGRGLCRVGGFLQDVDQFDAPFFGIAPREAMLLDPQQRLLLELVWEAFEDAGVDPAKVAGSRTAVLIGASAHDYADVQANRSERFIGNGYSNIGSTASLMANRISYKFDLQGPSLALDTACSSALTAVHLACQSIWQGESSMAVVGGVNLMLRPEVTVGFSKAGMLSPDGRCKSFDAAANGYVRGEGAGVILLKPYAQALADGDPIAALLLASVINQDGYTPTITMPSVTAQAAMLAEAYAQAGIAPHQVQYVEAHGTGTPVGDPIEAQALGIVLGKDRPAGEPCLIGSVKSNIGHLEAGAGIAGLIKAVLCLQHGQIPPTLHYKTPNPAIPFDDLKLRVVDMLTPWPDHGQPRIAGVNAFGFGGANAHVVLQAAPPPSAEATPAPSPQGAGEARSVQSTLVTLSARSSGALKALAASYADFMRNDRTAALADLAYTMNCRRSHHPHRLALLVSDRQQLLSRLRAFANNERAPNLFTGQGASEERPMLLFVYTGMGPQWWGMGRELLAQEPVFRASIVECDAIFQRIAGWSLLAAMRADEATSRMAETAVAQPANFALQVALTALWAAWGIKPTAVVGHSVGEIAAAYVAGALTLEEALLVTYHRSRLQQTVAGQGTMLAAELSVAEVEALLADHPEVSLAALNGPTNVTLAGTSTALQAIAQHLQAKERFNRFLEVEVAYHSYQMEPLAAELQASLATLQPRATQIPLYSTVTGRQIDGTDLDAGYWWRNVRQPVQLAPAIQQIAQDEYPILLEVGPHPVLAHSIQETLRAVGVSGQLFSSLRRQKPEQMQLLTTLAELYTAGVPVEWGAIVPAGRLIKLPTYPWQRERYWHESFAGRQDRLGWPGHPFLQFDQESPSPTWQTDLNDYLFPYLRDHQVEETVIFPAAGYVEAGLALHAQLFGATACTLEEVAFVQLLALDPAQVQTMQINLDQASGLCTIYSTTRQPRMADDEKPTASWTQHATMRVLPTPVNPPAPFALAAIQARCQNEGVVSDLYSALRQGGLHYGPYFQTNRQIWYQAREVLSRIEAPTEDGYLLHPTVLDGAFQALAAVIGREQAHAGKLYLPVGINQLTFYHTPGQPCWAYGRISQESERIILSDIDLLTAAGEVAVTLRGVRYQALPRRKAVVSPTWFYAITWQSAPLPHRPPLSNQASTTTNGHGAPSTVSAVTYRSTEHWLLLGEPAGLTTELQQALAAQGVETTLVCRGSGYGRETPDQIQLCPTNRADWDQLLRDLGETPISTLVYLWSLTPPGVDNEALPTLDEILAVTMPVVTLVQALAAQPSARKLRLQLVTNQAQVVAATASGEHALPTLVAAPLWGLGTLISNEVPTVACHLIDIALDDPAVVQHLAEELLANQSDEAVARRGAGRFVKQLLPAPQLAEVAAPLPTIVNTQEHAVTLEIGRPGQLDSLHFRPVERRAPAAGEIEVQVHTTALNFKDLLKVLGHLDAQVTAGTYFADYFGMECAGRVVAVGEGVTTCHVGDEVIVTTPGCFTNYVTVAAHYAVPKPDALTLHEAPVLIGYLTAYYGLVEVARLQAGERLLIHNATGGVGLAAVQIAQWIGAEIYATAGTEEKRAWLAAQGIQHIFDSRSLAFADQIKAATGGEGVDVVLNAIAGEALRKSLSILAPYGRFVEIGKKDIAENSGLPLAAFNRNLTFTAIDLDRIWKERLPLAQRLIKVVLQGFADGHLHAMPVTVFPASQASEAFRFLAQSKQIGKVVLALAEQAVPLLPLVQPALRPDGTYLITGGTGGLGLTLAQWLASKGVQQLVLVSRSGAVTPTAQAALAALERQGTAVQVAQVDISDGEQVATLVAQIRAEHPPLRGIFHGAMVLDDALLVDLDQARFARVMAPKVAGALHLHAATQGQPLDCFVIFSSIAALIGNVGQASYVAANAFLDHFAHYRRAQGLPATTINLGVLAEVGVVARDEKLQQWLTAAGIQGFTNQALLLALELILAHNPAQVGLFDVDWAQLYRSNPRLATTTQFAHFRQENRQGDNSRSALLATLRTLPVAERISFVATRVREQLASVLHLPLEKIDLHQKTNLLGVDSLMALELKQRLEREFGVEIPTMQLLNGPTVTQMAQLLLREAAIN